MKMCGPKLDNIVTRRRGTDALRDASHRIPLVLHFAHH